MWLAAFRVSDSWRGYPSLPVMTPCCDAFGRYRRRCSPVSPSAISGVDDWAWRKGREFGTILVNLDLHRVVDLLPDRAAESFSQWLLQHPEIVTISRDR